MLLEREVGGKLVLNDANSSAYVVIGSLLGLWDAGCARIGCVGDGVNLGCVASHPRRYTLGLLTQTIYYTRW